MKNKRNSGACYCGGMAPGAAYPACCQVFIEGGVAAPSAEHLMRSRYSAYVMGNADYLLSTWHASTRPADLVLEAPGTPHAVKWLGLTVHVFEQLNATQAQVVFTARYREGGRAHRLQEHSQFMLENGKWFYLAGHVDDI